MGFIDRYSYDLGVKVCTILVFLASLDILFQLFRTLHWNTEKYCDKIKEKYETFRTRWY